MKRGILISALVILVIVYVPGQSIGEIDTEGISSLTSMKGDTTYVINFWATWCSPCVKEIGYFEDLYRTYRDDAVKVVLVSLDFPNQLERRVVPFLKDKEISAPVYLMTDLNYNNWIERVDPSWSGAIPATLIYRNDRRVFLEKELSRDELFSHVKQIRN